ncbi:MAG: hypothetical protein ABFC89_12115 [Methanospirillum sp.]
MTRVDSLAFPLLLAVALLFAGCVGGPPGEGDPSLRHAYSYDVSVAIDRPVDGLVLRVPLPSMNGSSPLGQAIVDGKGYGVRPGWEVAIVEANGTPALEIRAERFLPEYRGTPIAIVPGGSPPPITPAPPATGRSESNPILAPYSLGASLTVNRSIETRDPAGHEPLLGGGEAPAPADCAMPGQGSGVRCYRHPVTAFIDYRADGPANASVGVRLTASNEWWRGGWTSNRYTDSVFVEFPSGNRGWTRADAVLTAGEGVYP